MYKLEIEEQAKEDLSAAIFWYETQQSKIQNITDAQQKNTGKQK